MERVNRRIYTPNNNGGSSKIEMTYTTSQLNKQSKGLCGYEFRFPSTARYSDTLVLQVASQANVNIHVVLKKIGQPLSNEELSENLYTFWDIPGSKYVSYDRKLSVNYPWTFVVLLEPTSNNLDADFALYYWFKDNAGVTSAQTIEESIIQETVPITIVKGAEKIEYVSVENSMLR